MTIINEQKITPPARQPAPATEAVPTAAKGRGSLRRAGTFAKNHPVLLLSGAAGAAALAGVPGAVTLMLGMGVAAFFGRKSGRQMREEVMSKGSSMLDRARPGASVAQGGPSLLDPHSRNDAALK